MSMRKIHSGLELTSKLKDSKECPEVLADKKDPLSILKDEKQVNELDLQHFLELITVNEDTVKFALSSPYIRKKLNELSIDENEQTFDYSCAAHCILRMLHDFKLIDKSEFTRAKELEIYQQIWESPGDIANPIKIYQYLSQQGIDVSIGEIEKRVKTILPAIPEEMKLAYSFIQSKKELKKTLYEEGSVLSKDKSYLLIAVCGHGIHFHILYAKCEDDKFIVFSPSSEDTKHTAEFHSFADFVSQCPLFTGMMYAISNPKKSELTQEKHSTMRFL